MCIQAKEENDEPRMLTEEEWDEFILASEPDEKYEEAVEYFKKVDWNEWKKVFAEAQAEYRKKQTE